MSVNRRHDSKAGRHKLLDGLNIAPYRREAYEMNLPGPTCGKPYFAPLLNSD